MKNDDKRIMDKCRRNRRPLIAPLSMPRVRFAIDSILLQQYTTTEYNIIIDVVSSAVNIFFFFFYKTTRTHREKGYFNNNPSIVRTDFMTNRQKITRVIKTPPIESKNKEWAKTDTLRTAVERATVVSVRSCSSAEPDDQFHSDSLRINRYLTVYGGYLKISLPPLSLFLSLSLSSRASNVVWNSYSGERLHLMLFTNVDKF